MSPDLIQKLKNFADKYETASFCDSDPSQFLRWYPKEHISDVECASFIAAMLAFGNRKQFIPKIRQILEIADSSSGGVVQWCLAGAPGFPHGEKKFYRFYSYDDMHNLFADLSAIFQQSPTLGEYMKGKAFPCLQPASLSSATPSSGAKSNTKTAPQRPVPLHQLISQAFPNSAIVPKGRNSANKRIHMFLRWMVRQNSPVDLGLWNWADPAELLIPLDVHVMQEGINLGLLPPTAKASLKTAETLTKELLQVFPKDPARGDYALFGLGVDENI